jgi:hypothetical protein
MHQCLLRKAVLWSCHEVAGVHLCCAYTGFCSTAALQLLSSGTGAPTQRVECGKTRTKTSGATNWKHVCDVTGSHLKLLGLAGPSAHHQEDATSQPTHRPCTAL